MGHEWIFDVLKDLRSYASANGLQALARKADEALQVAEAEIGSDGAMTNDRGPGGSAGDPKTH